MLKDHALLSGGRNVEKKHSKGAHALGKVYIFMQPDEPSDCSSPPMGSALYRDWPSHGIIPPTGSSLPRDHPSYRIIPPTGSSLLQDQPSYRINPPCL